MLKNVDESDMKKVILNFVFDLHMKESVLKSSGFQ